MHHLKKIIRIHEWWGHILPPILLFYYTGLLSSASINTHILSNAVYLILLSVITALSGYFINDLFDIQEDKKAGKKNIIAGFPLWLKIIFIPALLLILILLFLSNSYMAKGERMLFGIVYLLQLILFILYSVPPVRLKKRTWLAPVTDALYSGTFFYVFAFTLSSNHKLDLQRGIFFLKECCLISVIITFIWGFLRGIRNYLTHLSDDQQHDNLSGLVTLATVYKSERVQFIANLLYPLELICLIIIIVINLKAVLLPISACILFFILWIVHMISKKSLKNSWLNDLYEVWLPLIFIGIIIFNSIKLYPLLVLHLILFPYHIVKIYHFADAIYFYTLFKIIGPVRKKQINTSPEE